MLGRIFICAALAWAAMPSASAQTYPTKPVRLISPYPHGGGTDGSARCIVGNALPQVIHPDPSLDRQDALQQALRRHLAREEHHAIPALRDAQGNGERECGFAASNVAADDDQVATTHAATKDAIQAGEAGRDGIGRLGAVGDCVSSSEDLREGGNVGAPGHGAQDRARFPRSASHELPILQQLARDGPAQNVRPNRADLR